MVRRSDVYPTVVGFAGALAVFAVLFWVVGADRILDALDGARPALVALVVVVGGGWLAAWSLSLRTVLDVLDVDVSAKKSFLVYAGAAFLNNVTPFGQAGGEPFTAMLISRTSRTRYETGLAAIAGVDTLNFFPSIVFALVGVTYYATVVAADGPLDLAALAVVALAAGVPLLLYSAWRRRRRVERVVARLLTAGLGAVAPWIPRVSPPDGDAVRERARGFVTDVERVSADRRGLATALGFSALGWFLQAVALWLAFYALGVHVSLAVALFIVPVGTIAGVAPLPGGLGGIEAVLVALLVPVTGVSVALVTAAVIIYRGTIFWLPVVVGGGALAAFAHRETLPSP